MTFNSPPQKDGWGDDVKKEPQKSWAMWFQNVWLWIQSDTAQIGMTYNSSTGTFA